MILCDTLKSAGKTDDLQKRAAFGAAVDADLAKIAAAWPSLPEPIKRAMLALIG